MVCRNTKHAFSTFIHLYICKFDMIHVILISRLGKSVTTQSGSGRQYVGSGRQYVTGS